MTRVEESTPVASCEISSEDSNSNLAHRGRVERPGFGSRTRAFGCYWRVRAFAFIFLCAPCDAWYNSPFRSKQELAGALNWCYYGYGATYENCLDPSGRHISDWDVSQMNDMSHILHDGHYDMGIGWTAYSANFNADISRWDMSSVTSTSYMFSGAQSFNGDLSNWDVSSVTDMNSMFQNAHNFNVDLLTWNTHAVTSMSYMFQNVHNFNADISNWNTQSLAHMEKMFENAHSFNADITKWTCDAYESQRTRSQVEDMFKGADAWHASYVNTHTGYFDLNLGPPNMWVPIDEYKGDSFFAKDKRVQILIAFVAVLGAGLLGVVIFLIVRCATHRKRTAKKVTTQFRIAHAHNAVSQQQMLGMSPMPPGAPVLPGRSPIVVTLPAAAPPTDALEQ